MINTAIQVKTDQFDGPLGLLLHLVEAQEMKIQELDLGTITGQYLAYLNGMKKLNFDLAGDYLYMLATLLLLKSHGALNEDGQIELPAEFTDANLNITSKAELIRRLEELQHFQYLGQKLWNLTKLGHDVFIRPRVNKKEIIDSILTPLKVEDLIGPMLDLMRRSAREFQLIKGDKISLADKLKLFKENLKIGGQYEFSNLLALDDKNPERINILTSFLCLLELARLKKLILFQNEPFSTIYLEVLGNLEEVEEAKLGLEEAVPLLQ